MKEKKIGNKNADCWNEKHLISCDAHFFPQVFNFLLLTCPSLLYILNYFLNCEVFRKKCILKMGRVHTLYNHLKLKRYFCKMRVMLMRASSKNWYVFAYPSLSWILNYFLNWNLFLNFWWKLNCLEFPVSSVLLFFFFKFLNSF